MFAMSHFQLQYCTIKSHIGKKLYCLSHKPPTDLDMRLLNLEDRPSDSKFVQFPSHFAG